MVPAKRKKRHNKRVHSHPSGLHYHRGRRVVSSHTGGMPYEAKLGRKKSRKRIKRKKQHHSHSRHSPFPLHYI